MLKNIVNFSIHCLGHRHHYFYHFKGTFKTNTLFCFIVPLITLINTNFSPNDKYCIRADQIFPLLGLGSTIFPLCKEFLYTLFTNVTVTTPIHHQIIVFFMLFLLVVPNLMSDFRAVFLNVSKFAAHLTFDWWTSCGAMVTCVLHTVQTNHFCFFTGEAAASWRSIIQLLRFVNFVQEMSIGEGFPQHFPVLYSLIAHGRLFQVVQSGKWIFLQKLRVGISS